MTELTQEQIQQAARKLLIHAFKTNFNGQAQAFQEKKQALLAEWCEANPGKDPLYEGGYEAANAQIDLPDPSARGIQIPTEIDNLMRDSNGEPLPFSDPLDGRVIRHFDENEDAIAAEFTKMVGELNGYIGTKVTFANFEETQQEFRRLLNDPNLRIIFPGNEVTLGETYGSQFTTIHTELDERNAGRIEITGFGLSPVSLDRR